jgi:hypothetical protein
MSFKAIGAKILSKIVANRIKNWSSRPVETQQKVFKKLIEAARNTAFGVDHNFDRIQGYNDFKRSVPVMDYEGIREYIDRVISGEEDVLWPGKPIYFAKTSGTTSGAKYIPITNNSMPYHIEAARNAILCYIHETGNTSFVDGKMIFLQGSPKLSEKNGIKLGRLSGIVAHYVPKYLQKNRLPSWETNCIRDWEAKVDAIIEETINEDMTVISGIPSWVQMYFERIHKITGNKIGEVFKNFNLFIYGGVNYEPYRAKFESMIGRKVDSIELYPASEGFFAFQDKQKEKGMLLLLDAGIFYEFIEAAHFHDDSPERITIGEVKTGVNYVMIVSTNAGLWSYNLGDTIQFTTCDPYRIVVTGRITHFISAFGEHVIGKEVETAIQTAMHEYDFSISEFTVAPEINPPAGELPYHEWLIEFEEEPKNINEIAAYIDRLMQEQNIYYKDLIEGNILQPLKISVLTSGSFKEYMKSKGKLGGQNKIPRLSNDRTIANQILDSQV